MQDGEEVVVVVQAVAFELLRPGEGVDSLQDLAVSTGVVEMELLRAEQLYPV